MKQPLLVLADEPTGELDSKTGDEIYKILRSMQHTFQTTLVVVTHDRRFITPDDLVLEIQDGQVALESGTGRGCSLYRGLAATARGANGDGRSRGSAGFNGEDSPDAA